MEVLQSHRLRSEDSVGLVDSSKAAIADVRSTMEDVVVLAPLPWPCGVLVPD